MDQDEQEKRDLSNEDLLGAQSLLLSDSEDEDTDSIKEYGKSAENELYSIDTKEQKIRKDLESFELQEDEKKVSLDEINKTKVKSKVFTLVDSDSEISDDNTEEQKIAENIELQEYEKKFAVDESNKPKVKSKVFTLVDSDSEVSDDSSQCEQNLDTSNQLNSNFRSDSDLIENNEQIKNNNTLENSNLESEEENEKITAKESHEVERPKKMRLSAKAALDEIQAIQSEQQRLHREANISIPYHKPKKHTLDEFLKRRANINTSQHVVNSVKLFKNLKMSPEELKDYALLMEERAKEASKFFKSESDCEEECDNKSPEKHCELSIEETDKNETNSDDTTINKNEQDIENIHTVCFKKDTNTVIDASETTDIKLTTKPRITEIIELPRLDLQEVNMLKSPKTIEKCSKSLIDIKRLILEKKIDESPTLKGDSSMLIDFDTGATYTKKPTKADHLLQKLLLTNKTCLKKVPGQSIISPSENGISESSKAKIKIQDESILNKEQKPGAALFKLKENLKNVIKKKRLDDIKKKQENEHKELNFYNDDFEGDFEETLDKKCQKNFVNEEISHIIDNDDEENIINNFNYNADENRGDEETNVISDNDDDENISDSCDYDADDDIDNEDENEFEDEDDVENENVNNDEYEQEQLQLSENNNFKPIKFTRIIKKFEDDSEDEIDISKNSTILSSITMSKLLNNEQNIHINTDEDELLGLCSGRFDVTQSSNQALISLNSVSQNNFESEVNEDFLQLNSVPFYPKKKTYTEIFKENEIKIPLENDCEAKSINSSSIEKNVIKIAEKKKKVKKFSKKLKKGEMKLGFSDEEDSDDKVGDGETETFSDTFIDYDSEENEIVVEMSQDERLKQTKNFFENEAELSESEWGSADEDETNMDKYDIELGDEDDFDKEKLQTELGRIHARKMLDDDIKEVRKIQDLLFEDEENNGVGRQRQFRWKNAERGFCLEDANQDQAYNEKNISDDDENGEHAWRKIRFEREQVLKQHSLNEELSTTKFINYSPNNITQSNENQPLHVTKKINIIKIKNGALPNMIKDDTHFLIPKATIAQNKPSRGSFLIRDDETLTKLIKGTKSRNDIDAGGSVSINTIKPRNFVFATLTEEEHENLKRKADDLLSNSNENGINFMKRPQKKPRREKCFIDQLLQ